MVDGNKTISGVAFWALCASIDEFQYCYPLIIIDSTHIYGKYKVKLLVVVAYNMNSGVYPLYFAIVEEETNNNWSCFLDFPRRYMIDSQTGLCIISDRHTMIKNYMA
jgi:hypothetical protein